MPTPLHPAIVHLPIALSLILPVLILVFALMIRTKKMAPSAWLVIIGLQFMLTASGYVALETGETEEVPVAKVLAKSLINAHEEASEVFVGMTVLALAISIAVYFLRKEFQFRLQLVVMVLGLASGFLAYRTSKLGGELVYEHGAAQAHNPDGSVTPEGLLPTSGLNTSESAHPEPTNESLKPDENDYGNADESPEQDDEDLKQED